MKRGEVKRGEEKRGKDWRNGLIERLSSASTQISRTLIGVQHKKFLAHRRSPIFSIVLIHFVLILD